ncbi:2-dehydropantoate 2-reductase [Rhizobium mesosinicum]|uniref:2-dehydropantoate 2-reductase n=2 Tax=Rhizobium mesosinicum TaxID=335017 RepID=A0ABS7GME7_9HYPH|nr:2-dehydropantoate 2-reductase [Rhizobium mesosinicum]
MRILVLGAGGIGGYFGGRLAETGADVTFLVREKRQVVLREKGLRITSQFGDAALEVKTMLATELQPVFDAVILTCKAYDLQEAMETIAPGLAPTGFVLPLLNGIAQMEALNDRFGKDRVLGGSAKIQVTLTPEGVVHQLNDWRTITFGEQSGEMSPRILALADLFKATKGVDAHAVPDIMQRMWEKFVHLATAAAMTCLMRANVGEIVRTPEGGKIFLKLLHDSAKVSASQGFPPSQQFMQLYEDTFSQRDSLYTTSMLRDIERKGKTEVDHILGFMLRKAQEAEVDHETIRLAYTHVKAFEQRLAAGRLQ